MYKEFYGLTDKPFRTTPDPDFLFLSRNYQKAIACMEYGVMEETGVILLTGEIGTGKTTLIRHILTKFDPHVRVATIYNTNVNSEQLLELIIEAFNLNAQIENKAQALKVIQAGLEKIHANGLKPVIIFDDAQNLSLHALEEVRLLSNLQSHDRMLVQIILVGQPELKEKLDDPAAAALVQRIGITYHILPFNREETEVYIAHRLQTAGASIGIFDVGALDLIFKITKGNPRIINLICDQALVYGFADETKIITSAIVSQVFKDNPGLEKSGNFVDAPDSGTMEAEAIAISEALQIPVSPPMRRQSENWQQRVEGRLQTLEQLMSEYNKELREVIKSMFEKERQKSDDLMLKYAQLQAENQVLRQKLAGNESLQVQPNPQ